MAHPRRFTHLACGQIHVRAARSDDEAIAAVALHQLGVVARRQLLELGITDRSIDHRIAVGRLRRLHPGVYAVGHDALTFAARALAAVLSASPGSAASHLTAAALWGLGEPHRGPAHVTATRGRRPRHGVAVHRARLPEEDVAIIDGVPVTSVARTLLDLSATLRESALRRLIKRAEFLRLTDHAELAAILDRYPRRPGRRALDGLVAGYTLAAGRTRSELEDRFLRFCVERSLPMPETNVVLEVRGRRLEVDCVWREARLIVELDGRRAQANDAAFEDHRERDRALIAAGWAPIRVTWLQLHGRADALESEIRSALVTRTADASRFTHTEGG